MTKSVPKGGTLLALHPSASFDLPQSIARAACALQQHGDLPELAAQVVRQLRQAGLSFSSLRVYLSDCDQVQGRNYCLEPGPASWAEQAIDVDTVPQDVHLEQRQCTRSRRSCWYLTIPTPGGAVEIAAPRAETFGPKERSLLETVAPALMLLALRHRDVEARAGRERSIALPKKGRGSQSQSLALAGRARWLCAQAKAGGGEIDPFAFIVAQSPAMQGVVELARLAATTDETVLILGETGTGKDLLAQAIHAHSRRRDHPLVVVNCSHLDTGLEDSEMFGHVKGAFTGALQENQGLVAAAHRGTLFLDEVGELALNSQAKLLRCIEAGELRRVGDTQVHNVDLRVIAATNRDLSQAIQQGTFRKDLYYRLAVINLRVPPLRDRREDLPWLICFFLGEIAADRGLDEFRIATEALDLLLAAPWPGNTRQLRSCLRLSALRAGRGPIEAAHLPEEILWPERSASADLPLSLAELEKRHILQVLEQCGQDRQKTQELLGISRATLQRRLKEYGLSS